MMFINQNYYLIGTYYIINLFLSVKWLMALDTIFIIKTTRNNILINLKKKSKLFIFSQNINSCKKQMIGP